MGDCMVATPGGRRRYGHEVTQAGVHDHHNVMQVAMGVASEGKSTRAGVIFHEVCRRGWAVLSYALRDDVDLEYHIKFQEEKDKMREEAKRIYNENRTSQQD